MYHRKGIDLVAPIKPAHHAPFTSTQLQTISGMRSWEVLGAECGKCGRKSWLDKDKVLAKYGNQFLQNLDGKLVCRCGNREGNKVLLGHLGRD